MGLGLVLLILGSAFALVGRHQALRSKAMRSWPELEGTVTACGMTPFRRSGETQDERNLVTALAWEVDGQAHTLTFTQYAGWAWSATAPLPYTEGQKVKLKVNPLDASDAVFSSDAAKHESPAWPFLIAVLCGLISFPFWFFGGRMPWRASAVRSEG